MKTYAIVFGALLLLRAGCCAQEYPTAELGIDYSYARFGPSFPNSKGHSLNGGGGWAVYNFKDYVGLKMDLQGYGSNQTGFMISPSTNFPGGAKGNVQGNLFTYLFGPQVKIRAYQLQPYFHLLFGGAHTNVYGNAFKTICQPVAGACAFSKAPAADAFSMAFGGGIDVPLTKYIQFRPVEIDYLLTRFSNQFTKTNNQNTFRYCAGINFTFGNAY
jgi:Outer membrane protein beta-barrel domain